MNLQNVNRIAQQRLLHVSSWAGRAVRSAFVLRSAIWCRHPLSASCSGTALNSVTALIIMHVVIILSLLWICFSPFSLWWERKQMCLRDSIHLTRQLKRGKHKQNRRPDKRMPGGGGGRGGWNKDFQSLTSPSFRSGYCLSPCSFLHY